MLSNAYFLAKFRFDTAENEPAKNLQKFANFLCQLRAARADRANIRIPDLVQVAVLIAADLLVALCLQRISHRVLGDSGLPVPCRAASISCKK